VFSGEIARQIMAGNLTFDAQGRLTDKTLGDVTHATNGQSFKDLHAGLGLWAKDPTLAGAIDPNSMISQTQTAGQADGINEYANPAMKAIVNYIKAATPLGTVTNGIQAVNGYMNGEGAGALTHFLGGMAGNYLGGAAAKAVGSTPLSPYISSVTNSAVRGLADNGDQGLINGAVNGLKSAATSTADSFAISNIAKALGVKPSTLSGVLGATNATNKTNDYVKGALTKALSGQ
jgi:hypothetical protein